MILLALLTGIVVGPAAYFFAPTKDLPRRVMWTVVAIAASYALVIGLSIYFDEWLGAD